MPTTQVYTEVGQAAILDLQRQGARLVRMRRDGKRPSLQVGRTHGALSDPTPSQNMATVRRALLPRSLLHWIQRLGYRRWPMAGPGRRLPTPCRHTVTQDVAAASLLSRPRGPTERERAPAPRLSRGCTLGLGIRRTVATRGRPGGRRETAPGCPIPLVDDLAGEGRSGTAKTTREPARAATRGSTEGRPTERRLPWHAMGPASRSGESMGLHPRQRVQRPRPVPHRNPPVRRDAGQRDARPNRLLGRHHKRPREVRLLRRAIRMAKVAAGPRE